MPREERNSASAIVGPAGQGPRISLRKVCTPKPARNRVHVEVNAGGGGRVPLEERKARGDEEVERLEGLGASRPRTEADEREHWIGVGDPDGNGFCIQ